MKEYEHKGSKYIPNREVNNVFFYDADNDMSEFDMIVVCNNKVILEITTDNYYNQSWLLVNNYL